MLKSDKTNYIIANNQKLIKKIIEFECNNIVS